MAHIIFIDNFDSFSYNLVDQLRCLGHQVQVFRNHCDLAILENAALAHSDSILVLSPGPGTPAEAGNLLPLINSLKERIPMLGICLGHQAIIEAFCGKVVHAGEVVHGKVSLIEHDNKPPFANINNPMPVARYHSLMGTDIPANFVVNAKYQEIVMAIRHMYLPICSFQFHPESILTPQGAQLLKQSIDFLLEMNSSQNLIK